MENGCAGNSNSNQKKRAVLAYTSWTDNPINGGGYADLIFELSGKSVWLLCGGYYYVYISIHVCVCAVCASERIFMCKSNFFPFCGEKKETQKSSSVIASQQSHVPCSEMFIKK